MKYAAGDTLTQYKGRTLQRQGLQFRCRNDVVSNFIKEDVLGALSRCLSSQCEAVTTRAMEILLMLVQDVIALTFSCSLKPSPSKARFSCRRSAT
jgi:hypothetical protein